MTACKGSSIGQMSSSKDVFFQLCHINRNKYIETVYQELALFNFRRWQNVQGYFWHTVDRATGVKCMHARTCLWRTLFPPYPIHHKLKSAAVFITYDDERSFHIQISFRKIFEVSELPLVSLGNMDGAYSARHPASKVANWEFSLRAENLVSATGCEFSIWNHNWECTYM